VSKHRLRIRSIEVTNFKSLVDFKLPVAKFTCVIGLNGAGKSTLLQFIDFLSQLIRGNVAEWLKERQWKSTELKSKLIAKRNVEFTVHLQDDRGVRAGRWQAHYSPSEGRCTWERLDMLDYVLETSKNEVRLHDLKTSSAKDDGWRSSLSFTYEGSVLSSLREEILPESILRCKRFFRSIESLDMLTPDRLRQRTRSANGTLGHGGRNLSAFVYELGTVGRKAMAQRLKEVYPKLDHVYAKSLRSGWKQLLASERFGESKMWTEARHLNDGLLRLIAMLAEVSSGHGFILFDEIENGINPELVEFVIDLLVKAKQQVLVTTHSPMILNYLPDDVALAGVAYLYTTGDGHTQSVPFFSIPSLRKKLGVMGPGEAFADTNLKELGDEIARMPKE